MIYRPSVVTEGAEGRAWMITDSELFLPVAVSPTYEYYEAFNAHLSEGMCGGRVCSDKSGKSVPTAIEILIRTCML